VRVAKTIELDEHTERELRVLAKRRTVEARLQQRALVVLLAAEGRHGERQLLSVASGEMDAHGR